MASAQSLGELRCLQRVPSGSMDNLNAKGGLQGRFVKESESYAACTMVLNVVLSEAGK